MLNITEGVINAPQRVVIYGSEGVGKSTLAAHFPNPLFIDTEGSTKRLNVRRINGLKDWVTMLNAIREVDSGICKTLVIDTGDWAEAMCIKYTCSKAKKSGLEDFGYGKGYTYLQEDFQKLLEELDGVIERGCNVVITCHAKMRKFEQPDEIGAYDRWELKLTKQVAPILKEWADMVLFCNYQTFVVQDQNGKAKVQGGKRVIYTTHHACWDAKNRHDLPECLPLEWDSIKHCFEDKPQDIVVESPKEPQDIDWDDLQEVKGVPKTTRKKKKATEPIVNPPRAAVAEIAKLCKEDGIDLADLVKAIKSRPIAQERFPMATLIEDFSDEFLNDWVARYFSTLAQIAKGM